MMKQFPDAYLYNGNSYTGDMTSFILNQLLGLNELNHVADIHDLTF